MTNVREVSNGSAKWLPPVYDNIPVLLRQYDRWLVWVLDGNGRKTPRAFKRPDRDCDATKSSNWCALQALIDTPQKRNGPGFALGRVENGPTFAGVDLDDCRNPITGTIDSWAWDIIRALDSYTEVSPSGTGVKVFLTGALPEDSIQSKVYKLEIYDRKRYFTVTGHHVPGTPLTVESREDALRALYVRQRSSDLIELTKLFGLYKQHRGDWIDITCPWAEDHSTPDGERDTGLHLDDDEGQVTGFKCFHASHSETKSIADIHKLFGLKGSREGFKVGDDGKVIANSQDNVLRALAKLGIELTHDVFAQKLLATKNGRTGPLEDALLNDCWLLIDRTFGFRPQYDFFVKFIDNTARKHPFHPVRDYLDKLTWDGTPRIDNWLSTYAKAVDDAYTRAVGALVLIAAVRRVRQPGCKFDEMLVLESAAQGVFKSTALRTLCPNEEWFSDDLPLNVNTQQMIERTLGKWIIEASDLSGMRKADAEHLKAMLSRQVDGPVRMAYGRLPIHQPRHFIIIGTTNTRSGYLKDTTGARRFWPVHIERFDIDSLRRDRDQLWAEAVTRESRGDSIRLPETLYPNASREQEQRRHVDMWEEILDELIDPDSPPDYIDTKDVWSLLGVQANHCNNHDAQRVAEIMQRLGYPYKKQCRRGTPPKKGWYWLRTKEAEQDDLFTKTPIRTSFITEEK